MENRFLINNRINKRFSQLKENNKSGLVAFVTANDPTPEVFEEILNGLSSSGADIIEVGIPFSDPMADGPSIQRSSQRALDVGFNFDQLFLQIKAMRRLDSETPIILMGYYNPIFNYGPERFSIAASKVGVDGVIVVDLPPEESEELSMHLLTYDLQMIYLLAPTTDFKRLPIILERANGFLYYVAIKGVTGTRAPNEKEVNDRLNLIKRETNLPIAVGFGIKTAEHASKIASFADAVVVGSAIVDVISDALEATDRKDLEISSKVLKFVKLLSDGVVSARIV